MYGEGYRRNYEDSDIIMGEIVIKTFNTILIIIMGILIDNIWNNNTCKFDTDRRI